jgi:hypothetical protein
MLWAIRKLAAFAMIATIVTQIIFWACTLTLYCKCINLCNIKKRDLETLYADNPQKQEKAATSFTLIGL